MEKLKGLKPEKVFEFFEYISSVPRGSGNTSQVSELCMKFAKERGLTAFKDKVNNVVIYKAATPGYEDAPTVVLQGHLDMVANKTTDCTKDMATEPIDLMHNDKYIYADKTTLGGDDGIAVAYALAILDSNDIEHPAIEAVFTIDEETGMEGAKEINPSLISGRLLLNIDSEEEGVFTCGCAGGCRVNGIIPVTHAVLGKDDPEKTAPVEIGLKGLKGGHSGADIDKQPASANYLLGRVLRELYTKNEFSMVNIAGGEFDNVICQHAKAVIAVEKDLLGDVSKFISDYDNTLRAEYSCVNPDMVLSSTMIDVKDIDHKKLTSWNEHSTEGNLVFLDKASTLKVLNAITLPSQGVLEMNMELAGMVQTSQNLGIVALKDDAFHFDFLVRSSIESQKESAVARIRALVELLGGKISTFGNYPGFKFEADSKVRDICVEAYRECYGSEPVVNTIHAGIECGIFCDKIPGMDAVSFGPNILSIHTPDEKLDIASVERVWNMILLILKKIK